ncbi:Co-chaperone [Salix suchowensis]|nr:Co-chaperone [Salix suchowensis]
MKDVTCSSHLVDKKDSGVRARPRPGIDNSTKAAFEIQSNYLFNVRRVQGIRTSTRPDLSQICCLRTLNPTNSTSHERTAGGPADADAPLRSRTCCVSTIDHFPQSLDNDHYRRRVAFGRHSVPSELQNHFVYQLLLSRLRWSGFQGNAHLAINLSRPPYLRARTAGSLQAFPQISLIMNYLDCRKTQIRSPLIRPHSKVTSDGRSRCATRIHGRRKGRQTRPGTFPFLLGEQRVPEATEAAYTRRIHPERNGHTMSEEDKLDDMIFISEVMEAREEIENADNPVLIQAIREENRGKISDMIDEIESLIEAKDWAAVKEATIRLKYLEGIERAAHAHEDAHS